MANYPQPPYGGNGMPYSSISMPPQPPQVAPAPHGTPQDLRTHAAMAADGFHYNQQQYWPPPYQPSHGYQPVPFPPPMMGQNGMFLPPPPPPPPPPPNTGFYAPVPTPQFPLPSAPVPNHQATMGAQLPRPQQQMGPPARDRVLGMSEGDKEEGELSEGDRVSRSPARKTANPVPPPRSVPYNVQGDASAATGNGTAPQGVGHDLTQTRANDPSMRVSAQSNQQRDQDSTGMTIRQSISHDTVQARAKSQNNPVPIQATHHSVQETKALDELERKKREETKRFIALLYDNGVSYEQLVSDGGLHAGILWDLFLEANLPVQHSVPTRSPIGVHTGLSTNGAEKQSPGPKPGGSAISPQTQHSRGVAANGSIPRNSAGPIGVNSQDTQVKPAPPPQTRYKETQSQPTPLLNTSVPSIAHPRPQDIQAKPIPPLKTSVATTAPVKSAPSPIDRKDYIARLQAAKTGKSAPAKTTPPQKSEPALETSAPVDKVSLSSPPKTVQVAQTAPGPMSDAEKARKTELVRQKIQALQAAQAKKPLTPGAGKVLSQGIQGPPSQVPSPPATDVNGQEAGKSAISIQAPTGDEGAKRAYIGNVLLQVEEATLRNALSRFGEIDYLDINRSRKCAFAGFTTPAALHYAINNNPLKVNGVELRIEERRTRRGGPNSAGSNVHAPQPTHPSFNPVDTITRPQDPALTPQFGRAPQLAQAPQPAQGLTFPGIPGLFMTSSPSQPSLVMPPPPLQHVEETRDTNQVQTRKRPVASDFDEEPTVRPKGPGFTRPLGQSPHEHDDEPMIIEVSEDESEGDRMEIDEDDGTSNAPVGGSAMASQAGQSSLRNFGPLSNFPSRPPSVKSSSVVSTPPSAPTPTSLSHQEYLKKTEVHIAELRKKIAEKERLKKEKLAALKTIGGSSPTRNLGFSAMDRDLDGPAKTTPTPSYQMVNKDNTSKPGSVEVARTTTSVDAPDWRKQRRAEIESGLPSLDASLAENAARLSQLRQEMERLEADNRKRIQDKENLIKELESLGIDTEGMPHEELQAKKNEIVQQIENEAALQAYAENTQSVQVSGNAKSSAKTVESIPATGAPPGMKTAPMKEMDIPKQAGLIPGLAVATDSGVLDSVRGGDMGSTVNESVEKRKQQIALGPDAQPLETKDNPSASTAPAHVSASPIAASNGDVAMDDAEDFYSLEPDAALLSDEKTKQGVVLPDGISQISAASDPRSPSEEGEVAMSESSEEEEEYEPEEPEVVPPTAAPISPPGGRAREAVVTSLPVSSPSDEEEDAYKPPEINPQAGDPQPTSVPEVSANGEGRSGTEEYVTEDDDAMSLASDDSDSSEESDYEPLQNDSQSPNGAEPPSNATDHLAPQPQPTDAPERQVTISEPTLSTNLSTNDTTPYVPYESPLRMFKSYRYHPNFSKEVAGGFSSMTYSHQIDADRPLCSFEASGGICNDPRCEGQHFKDLAISGDKILVQLGTANPGRTPEDRNAWVDGLKLVLKDLRAQGLKDPNVVAEEISKFRRRFLKDDTRIINIPE
ncbi:hypothetical protein GQ43DRAFT_314342 [Delitschia confertaspora ATCC 74209]|uniref:RRM domain-containing protein n=1 Tax=Delitschia confertaspora ATCC 74209 TaxID=1513339 RepID=A0A9P4JQ55_9PLEO|nr:hypothetical protein GQ43DRAFT_314342 [Delitschia confertaspora ATCC 74209]